MLLHQSKGRWMELDCMKFLLSISRRPSCFNLQQRDCHDYLLSDFTQKGEGKHYHLSTIRLSIRTKRKLLPNTVMSNLNREAVWDRSRLMLASDMKSRFSVENRKIKLSPVPEQTLFVTVVEISREKHTLV